jgi:hypothetical protein
LAEAEEDKATENEILINLVSINSPGSWEEEEGTAVANSED